MFTFRLSTLLTLVLAASLLGGCKGDKNKPATPAPKEPAAATKVTPAPKVAPKPAPAAPAKLVKKVLTRTALTIEVPENATVGAAIIAGADSVTFPGHGLMVVKPRLMMDKELEKLVPWAKGHQMQKYVKDVLKTGSGKTYTYMYAVTMGGMPMVIYHQMFQQRGKDYMCFANAKTEAAAKAFKAACDTIAIATEPGAKQAKQAKKAKKAK